MVFTTLAPITRKDKIVFQSSSSVLQNSNGRRVRSRTSIATRSSVVASREPARNARCRRTHFVAPSRALRFLVADADSDAEMTGIKTSSGSKGTQKTVTLPRCLMRAPFKDISRAALEATDPNLKGVALEFVRDGLKVLGPQLYDIAATSTVDAPRERLPRELEVVVNNISGEAPTHLLAVHSKPATRVSLFPVHALVLAAHCAHVPPFPHADSKTPAEAGSKLTLPVTPFCIPNPETFSIILYYLYTKRMERVFAALLPIPLRGVKPSVDQLSQLYAATFTVHTLLSHAAKVHGLWSNVTALGVFDDKLSRVIEVAWEVLLSALAIKTGMKWEPVSQTSSQQ